MSSSPEPGGSRPEAPQTYSAFAGTRCVSHGPLEAMLRKTKRHLERGGDEPVLIFDDRTGRQVDFDFRGSADDVVARALPPDQPAGPGRPRLGVVSREVSLLPRHWEWLEDQPHGMSGAIRRLVDEARKLEPEKGRAERRRAAASRFMWSIAGNLPDFEEATRALFAGEDARLDTLIKRWPADVRKHIRAMIDG